MRTGSLVSASRLKLGWTLASERLTEALAIIEDLDVGKHLLDGRCLGIESCISQKLHFHRREEGLHECVFSHVAPATVAHDCLVPSELAAK